MIRAILNFLIVTAAIFVAEKIGWIHLSSLAPQSPELAIVVLSIIVFVAVSIVWLVFGLLVAITLGCGCVFLPVAIVGVGWLVLTVLASVTGWFELTVPFFWQGLVLSIFLGVVRFPSQSTLNATARKTSDVSAFS